MEILATVKGGFRLIRLLLRDCIDWSSIFPQPTVVDYRSWPSHWHCTIAITGFSSRDFASQKMLPKLQTTQKRQRITCKPRWLMAVFHAFQNIQKTLGFPPFHPPAPSLIRPVVMMLSSKGPARGKDLSIGFPPGVGKSRQKKTKNQTTINSIIGWWLNQPIWKFITQNGNLFPK